MNWNLFIAARVAFFRAYVLFGALLAPLIVHPSEYYSHFLCVVYCFIVKMGTAGSFEISDMLSCLLSIGTVNV
jgi:hypothetical protein